LTEIYAPLFKEKHFTFFTASHSGAFFN